MTRWLSPRGSVSAIASWPFSWYTDVDEQCRKALAALQCVISRAVPSLLSVMSLSKLLLRDTAKCST